MKISNSLKIVQNAHPKKVLGQKFRTLIKFKNSIFFHHFLVYNKNLSIFSTDSKYCQNQILHFLIPLNDFLETKLYARMSTFCKLEANAHEMALKKLFYMSLN